MDNDLLPALCKNVGNDYFAFAENFTSDDRSDSIIMDPKASLDANAETVELLNLSENVLKEVRGRAKGEWGGKITHRKNFVETRFGKRG
jgi:hypothetical protein